MKKVIISSVVTALLIFSGCADKDPVVENDSKTSSQASSHSSEEVMGVNSETIESSTVDQTTSDSNEKAMANLEKQLESIYFNFDKFDIRSDMKENVTKDASFINGPAKVFTIKLEGNCDEWGSDEYNFALGLRRSSTVKKSLVAEGVDASRITMVSYGESNPVCRTQTQACWAENRRVDLKLLP